MLLGPPLGGTIIDFLDSKGFTAVVPMDRVGIKTNFFPVVELASFPA
jgi:hypothetical protein